MSPPAVPPQRSAAARFLPQPPGTAGPRLGADPPGTPPACWWGCSPQAPHNPWGFAVATPNPQQQPWEGARRATSLGTPFLCGMLCCHSAASPISLNLLACRRCPERFLDFRLPARLLPAGSKGQAGAPSCLGERCRRIAKPPGAVMCYDIDQLLFSSLKGNLVESHSFDCIKLSANVVL